MRGLGWAEMEGFVNTPRSKEVVSFSESPTLALPLTSEGVKLLPI